jgi:hypothetical protein
MRMFFNTSICILVLIFGCSSHSEKNGKPPVIVDASGQKMNVGAVASSNESEHLYDVNKPDKQWRLPDQLIEVSGNAWVDKDHLILIEDLHPELYLIKLNGSKAELEKTIPFADTEKDKYDIEDVAIVNNTVYALYSHGSLFKINDWNGNDPKVEKFKTFLKKDNDSEGLCFNPANNNLLIACKGEPGIDDADKFTKAVYSFDLNSGKLDKKPFMVIKENMFKEVDDKKLEFYPSAIGIHPQTKDIYILSTKDTKCLAVFTPDGSGLKSFQFIDKDLMPQPEGICFSPEGVMYITSEGKKGDPGNLFQFNPR